MPKFNKILDVFGHFSSSYTSVTISLGSGISEISFISYHRSKISCKMKLLSFVVSPFHVNVGENAQKSIFKSILTYFTPPYLCDSARFWLNKNLSRYIFNIFLQFFSCLKINSSSTLPLVDSCQKLLRCCHYFYFFGIIMYPDHISRASRPSEIDSFHTAIPIFHAK